MRKLFLFTLFIAATHLNAQNLTNSWAKSVVSTSANNIIETATGNGGKIIYATQYSGTMDANIDAGVNNVVCPGTSSFLLSCLDANGNYWFSAGGGAGGTGTHTIKDMLVDGDTVYVVGEFLGTMQFNGNAIVWNGPSNAQTGFIAKFEINTSVPAFIFKWAIPIGPVASGLEGVTAISKGKFGTKDVIWTTGYYTGTVNFNPSGAAVNKTSAGNSDIFLAAYNRNGVAEYVHSLGGSGLDRGTDIVSDDNNVALTGDFSGVVNFGTVTTPNNLSSPGGNLDVFVTKYSTAAGTVDWAKGMGSILGETAVSIGADAGFNVYTTGNFSGTANFDAATTHTVASVNGTGDVFVTKHDVNGNFMWVNRYGGYDTDDVGKIAVEPNGDHMITGSYRLGPTINASTVIITSFIAGTSQRNAYITKFDATGNFVYSRNIAGAGSNFGRALNITPAGNIYIGGRFSHTTSYNLQTGGAPTLTVGGAVTNSNGFLAKYINCPTLTVTATANNACSGQPVNFTATSGYSTYAWAGPASYTSSAQNPTIAASTTTMSGNYTLTATDNNGCQATATTSVTVNLTPATPTFNFANNPVCAGNTVTLALVSPGTWYATATSTTALATSTNSFVTPTLTSTTSFYASNISGSCESPRAVRTVTVNPVPNAPVITGGSQNICEGDYTMITMDVTSNWYSVPTGGTFSQTSLGYGFTQTVTTTVYADITVNGCTSFPRTPVTVTVNPLPAILSQTVQNSNCYGVANGSVSLTLNNPGSYTYSWTPGISTTYSATNLAAGNYTVQIGSAGCVRTQTYNITQPAAYTPTVNMLGGNTLALAGMFTNTTFQWIDCSNGNTPIAGETNITYAPTANGSYAVIANIAGCPSTSTCVPFSVASTTCAINTSISQNGNTLSSNQNGAAYQWIDCNNGNTAISGATAQAFTPTVTGNYAVTITSGTCVSTSSCTQVNIIHTGVAELNNLSAITLQPNPASGYFTLGNVAEGTTIDIIDVTGKSIISQSADTENKTVTFETSILSNGIYFIQLKNNGAIVYKKLIISK